MQKWNISMMIIGMSLGLTLIRCGGNDDDDDVIGPDFQSINPSPGTTVPSNQIFTLNFSGPATSVTVNGTPTTSPNGKTVTWSGNLPPGRATLNIAWEGGAGATANFTVTVADTQPPELTGGDVKDGDTGVDPDPLNADGITLEFSETLSGSSTLKLTKDDGETEVGWSGAADGNEYRFELTTGNALQQGTTYKIEGTVKDAAGNEGEISLTFVTAAGVGEIVFTSDRDGNVYWFAWARYHPETTIYGQSSK